MMWGKNVTLGRRKMKKKVKQAKRQRRGDVGEGCLARTDERGSMISAWLG